jgi:hypothetical protein
VFYQCPHCLKARVLPHITYGAVRNVVGILRGVVSGNMILPDQAARSTC